jgi:hypothetical protein
MLCASGFKFEEKLQRARVEHENAQRALQSVSDLHQRSSERSENASDAITEGCRTSSTISKSARCADGPRTSTDDSVESISGSAFCSIAAFLG